MPPPIGAGHNNNHDDINNNHDDYSAVIMTEVIARVHSVHLVNVEQRQQAYGSKVKVTDKKVSKSLLVCTEFIRRNTATKL